MANNSDDIRRLINLMESVQQPTLVEGWVDNLKNKLDRRLGNKERAKMADQLGKEYYTWLGHTNRKGTIEDMERFMQMRIGFNEHDIATVMDNVGLNAPAASSSSDDETKDQTIAKGNPNATSEPKVKSGKEWDPEEGVPIPDDLNTKLSDFAKFGIDVEKDDGKLEPKEVRDDPRKYRKDNGEWDRRKISARLNKMPIGSKLTLGTSTFSRSIGDDKPAPAQQTQAAESIMEAGEADTEVLDRQTVKNIMDASAAQVNDAYLFNGPERDKEAAQADAGAQNGRNNRTGAGNSSEATPNKPGKSPSGQYDAKEMYAILKTDFQKGPAWVESVTRKVMQADSISDMTDADMQDLALLGWALVRARN